MNNADCNSPVPQSPERRVITITEGPPASPLPSEADVLIVAPGMTLAPAELQELQEVLHAGERHGAACARSLTTGTWTSFPLYPSPVPLAPATLLSAHSELCKQIPRFTIVPAAPCLPILIKGELLDRYPWAQGEPFDPFHITMRFSRYGYSTVVANRILFRPTPRPQIPCVSINDTLAAATPYYPEFASLLRYYLARQVHPLERFAELLGGPHRPRLLFSLLTLRPNYNGTSEYSLSLLRELSLHYSAQFDITVLAPDAAVAFHHLRQDYPRVVSPETITGVFDLGFMPSQIMDARFLSLMDHHCLRIAFTLLDIIWLRSGYLMDRRPQSLEVLRTAIRFADGITTLSETGRADAQVFFGPQFGHPGQVIRPIFPGVSLPTQPLAPLPPDLAPGYVLIVGNLCHHKAISECVSALAATPHRLVVLGDPAQGILPEHVRHFPSGKHSPELVGSLYAHCSALIFPSQYEGFGLPVAQALSIGKPVVLFPITINHEVVTHFSVRTGQAIFCSSFARLPECLDTALSLTTIPSAKSPFSWQEAAMALQQFLTEVSLKPVSPFYLEERRLMCQLLDEANPAKNRPAPARRVGRVEGMAERLMPLFRQWRTRCPRLYEWIARPYRHYILKQ